MSVNLRGDFLTHTVYIPARGDGCSISARYRPVLQAEAEPFFYKACTARLPWWPAVSRWKMHRHRRRLIGRIRLASSPARVCGHRCDVLPLIEVRWGQYSVIDIGLIYLVMSSVRRIFRSERLLPQYWHEIRSSLWTIDTLQTLKV